MIVERYTPFEEMDRMFERMRGRMWGFGDLQTGVESRTGERRGTHVDLHERDGEFVLVADLPGFEREEIDLTFDHGTLTVSANHEVTGDDFARSREVSERVTLPKAVEREGISATYRNGVLEVRLPVADPAEAGDRIEISD